MFVSFSVSRCWPGRLRTTIRDLKCKQSMIFENKFVVINFRFRAVIWIIRAVICKLYEVGTGDGRWTEQEIAAALSTGGTCETKHILKCPWKHGAPMAGLTIHTHAPTWYIATTACLLPGPSESDPRLSKACFFTIKA